LKGIVGKKAHREKKRGGASEKREVAVSLAGDAVSAGKKNRRAKPGNRDEGLCRCPPQEAIRTLEKTGSVSGRERSQEGEVRRNPSQQQQGKRRGVLRSGGKCGVAGASEKDRISKARPI